MDFKERFKKLESEKIHEELFQRTTEYKYYEFGVAQGMYFIYNTIKEYDKKGFNLKNNELMQVIKNCASTNEKISNLFIRMLKDIKSE